MARSWGRKGRPWRKVQAEVYAEETHCYFCGRYVDQTLLNFRGSLARSVHHLIPPDVAPELAHDRGNLRLAHLGHNSSYGRGAFEGAPVNGAPTSGHSRGLPIAGCAPRRRGTRRWAAQPQPTITSRLW